MGGNDSSGCCAMPFYVYGHSLRVIPLCSSSRLSGHIRVVLLVAFSMHMNREISLPAMETSVSATIVTDKDSKRSYWFWYQCPHLDLRTHRTSISSSLSCAALDPHQPGTAASSTTIYRRLLSRRECSIVTAKLSCVPYSRRLTRQVTNLLVQLLRSRAELLLRSRLPYVILR